MTFEEALPQLLTAYSKEELVPFTGAGLSAGACTLWFDFVAKLCRYADLPQLPEATSGPSDLVRLADRAVQILLNRSSDALQGGVREALKGSDYRKAPVQAELLAKVYWPLILTTNYDDWLVGCFATQPWSQEPESQLRILGRSPADCYEVLTSLYVRAPPTLWALQGFLGGQYQEFKPLPAVSHISRDLANQVVVGHQQYQLVMHREPHFRRAFSEVLRRRSLLFIGSGLQEDYLLNLFGEVQIMHGPGSLPHYALVRDSANLAISNTLLARYNIVPITYNHFSELPDLLDRFAARVEQLNAGGFVEERRYALELTRPERSGHLAIRQGSLPFPEEGTAAAISVGLDANGGPKLGTSAQTFLAMLMPHRNVHETQFEPLQEPGFFEVRGMPQVYALAAREPGSADRRDLRLLAPTVKRFLELCVARGLMTVHLPLLAAGEGSKWHPSFPLIETVRGVRMFVASYNETLPLPKINIHVRDPSVLYLLRAGKLYVEENLYCDDLRFWTIVEREVDTGERLLLVKRPTDTVGDVAAFLGLAEGWDVSISPAPIAYDTSEGSKEGVSATLRRLGVTNYSTLIFSRPGRH